MTPNQKPRAAIYARYSSPLQSPLSIPDQIALCRRLIERELGIDAAGAAVFSDAKLTGKTMKRPGLNALLRAAARGEFTVVATEGLDRIARSLRDTAEVWERLAHHGVTILSAHEGVVSQMHVGFMGTMNEIFLSHLKDKIKRGQRARAEEGRHPSSRAYGYRVVRGVVDGKGCNVNGLREIDPEQAKVVRRIFEEFAAGRSPKAIARGLNAAGIPSSGGTRWWPGVIKGNKAGHGGILNNELYRGVLIYNRTSRVTDPVTKARYYEPNPESEWTRTMVPDLRIVDEALWKRTRKMMVLHSTYPSAFSGRPMKRPVPSASLIRPFTGLVRCGRCGGVANLADRRRYVCRASRFTEECDNYRAVKEPELQKLVFPRLREALAAEGGIRSRIAATVREADARHAALENQESRLTERIERLLVVVEEGIEPDKTSARIRELGAELKEIRKAMKSDPARPPPEKEIRAGIRRVLNRIEDEFQDQGQSLFLRDVLKLVIESIAFTPIADKKRGSMVEVQLRPEGWPALWRLVSDAWPETVAPPARKADKR